jgi:hypothetical protein
LLLKTDFAADYAAIVKALASEAVTTEGDIEVQAGDHKVKLIRDKHFKSVY